MSNDERTSTMFEADGDTLRDAMSCIRKSVKQPAKPVELTEIIEALCARIKAADDAAADRDYMLDSDDCIAVIRGTWKAPMMNDKPVKQEAKGKS
jgi:hypothetical protein